MLVLVFQPYGCDMIPLLPLFSRQFEYNTQVRMYKGGYWLLGGQLGTHRPPPNPPKHYLQK